MKNLVSKFKCQVLPFFIALFLLFNLTCLNGFAVDTVVRKDGTLVKGTITHRDDTGVTIDIGVAEFFIPASDVKSISFSDKGMTLNDVSVLVKQGQFLEAMKLAVEITNKDATVGGEVGGT